MNTKVVANGLIIGLVAVGTIFLGSLAEISKDSDVMPTLFFCFFGLIIAIQVVPALMLFGTLIREAFRRMPKKSEQAGARSGNES